MRGFFKSTSESREINPHDEEKLDYMPALAMIHYGITVALHNLHKPYNNPTKVPDKINNELYKELKDDKTWIEELQKKALESKSAESQEADTLELLQTIRINAFQCLKNCCKIIMGEEAKSFPTLQEKKIDKKSGPLEDLIDPDEVTKLRTKQIQVIDSTIYAARHNPQSILKEDEVGAAFNVLTGLRKMILSGEGFTKWLNKLPQEGFPIPEPIGTPDYSPAAVKRTL